MHCTAIGSLLATHCTAIIAAARSSNLTVRPQTLRHLTLVAQVSAQVLCGDLSFVVSLPTSPLEPSPTLSSWAGRAYLGVP